MTYKTPLYIKLLIITFNDILILRILTHQRQPYFHLLICQRLQHDHDVQHASYQIAYHKNKRNHQPKKI